MIIKFDSLLFKKDLVNKITEIMIVKTNIIKLQNKVEEEHINKKVIKESLSVHIFLLLSFFLSFILKTPHKKIPVSFSIVSEFTIIQKTYKSTEIVEPKIK